MSFRTRLENKNSQKVVDGVKHFRPGLHSQLAPSPCHIIREEHAGVLVPAGDGYLLAYRCQLKWWGRFIDGGAAKRLTGTDYESALMIVGLGEPHQVLDRLRPPAEVTAVLIYVSEQSK